MRIARLSWLLICCTLLLPLPSAAKSAREVFNDLNNLVFQVRVIDVASGNKSSIGSGFQVHQSGRIATNFHVVSSFVHEPDKYRIEVLDREGVSVPAHLQAIDVVHDLAIVQASTSSSGALAISERSLAKGERIFSMGNPQDLGMTIAEGNYNGLIKTSRRPKFLFSGSLNPGMSGGPALDGDGAVIGINVARQGEQLGFLVPAADLVKLMRVEITDVNKRVLQDRIRDGLLADQDDYYGALLAASWHSEEFGGLMLPSDLDSNLKCWGHSVDEEDIDYRSFHQHCQSQNDVFVRDDFRSGRFFYDYEWLLAHDLNRFQLYSALQQRFTHRVLDNLDTDKHAADYRCHTDLIDVDATAWKASVCFRAYKDYVGLHDALLLLASLQYPDRAAIVKVGATGISKEHALQLFANYLGAIKWKP